MEQRIATPIDVEDPVGIFKDRILTNSARSDFINCRKKFFYTYVCLLSPRKLQLPFLVGGLFHEELERFYLKGVLTVSAIDRRVTEKISEASKSHTLDALDMDRLWVQRAILVGMLDGYRQTYKADHKKWKILDTEKRFKIALSNGWHYSGMIDMVVQAKKKTYIVEHKTTSRLDAGYIGRLPLDNQIIGYSWGFTKKTKRRPEGVIYNVTKKPQLRQGASEKLEAFMQRIKEDYLLNPSKYFYRETLRFNRRDLVSFQQELVKLMEEMDRCSETGFYYKNPTACTMYGRCQYMMLCTNGMTDDTLSQYSVKVNVHPELSDKPSKRKGVNHAKKGQKQD